MHEQHYRYTQDSEPCVTIIGDSGVHRVQKHRFNNKLNDGRMRKFTLPGYESKMIEHCIDVELQDQNLHPDTVVIHAGSNDLANYPKVHPAEVAQNIINIGVKCKNHGVKNIFISSITPRKFIHKRRVHTNRILEQLCETNNFTFIDNYNINYNDLRRDNIHLNDDGLEVLEDNFLYYLNGEDVERSSHHSGQSE